MTLTGRYKFEPSLTGRVLLIVEEHGPGGYNWRKAKITDLLRLEPEVKDGWRFREERDGTLDPIDGKRYRS